MHDSLSRRADVKKCEAGRASLELLECRTFPGQTGYIPATVVPTPRKEEVMKRRSIVCVSLLLVSAASVARADVEFAVPDRKAAAAKSAPTPAAAPAPEPTISQKP